MSKLYGYAGKLLRVDLTTGRLSDEALDEATLRQLIGGTLIGVKYLYNEVPPEAAWSDPVNRLIIASGPLAGTNASGSGTISVVTKGAKTNGFTTTQANGFLGAYLKFCGYDGIIFQGAAPDWVYLHVDDEGPQLRDAKWLLGKDTWETQEAIEQANPGTKYSVFGIGPAGEHLVRFAGIIGDRGHAAAHNGPGAVAGSKKLKAIAVARGRRKVDVFDPKALSEATKRFSSQIPNDPVISSFNKWGTAGHFSPMHAAGMLPVKNYTTSVFPEHEQVNGQLTRTNYRNKKVPCQSCQVVCCRMTTVTEGPYAGYYGEEPEYEGYAACSSLIGNTEPGGMVMLANLIDRLGFDINEAGYVMSFAMECFERGLIKPEDADGLDLRWGNVEAAATLLRKVAHREGKIGQLLADGVRAAAERLGGEALNIGVYTLKDNAIRGHDHRAKWDELLDSSTSNTGTIEACVSLQMQVRIAGVEPVTNKFDWEQVSAFNAKMNGWRHWVDSLGICNFNLGNADDQLAAVQAVTGWQFSVEEAFKIGRRAVNQMRVYNLRCGITADVELPSMRYASAPIDGPAGGHDIGQHFGSMRRNFFKLMGWDEATGVPKPETLRAIGLENILDDLASVSRRP